MTTKTKLTDTKVKSAKPRAKPYKEVDGNAMYLLVGTNGSKTWIYQYKMAGVRQKDLVRAGVVIGKAGETAVLQRTVTLGEYPAMSLADARAARNDVAALVKSGVHPKEHQQQLKTAETAAAKADEAANDEASLSHYCWQWFKSTSKDWSEGYKEQMQRYVERYVDGTALGPRHVGTITYKEVRELLESIARREGLSKADLKNAGLRKAEAPHVAKTVRRFLVEAFSEALNEGKCESNPAASVKPSKVTGKLKTQHNTKLTPPQLAQLVRAIDGAKTAERMRIALRLLLLTFTHSSELRCASWPEFDFDEGVWTIPAARMKMREPHIVPLAPQAITLLKRLREICEPTQGKWLFPNVKGAKAAEAVKRNMPDAPMGVSSFNRVLKSLGFIGPGTVDFTSHGARGTAYTLLSGAGFKDKVIDRQLAHQETDQVKKAYDAAELLPERTDMLYQWANYLQKIEHSTGG